MFKDKIRDWWVALSALYAGILSQFRNIKNFFSGSDEELENLKERLEQSRKVEKDLINTLMQEREVYKEKISRLEDNYQSLEEQITHKKKELENYTTFEEWRENVYEKMPQEAKEKVGDEIFGATGNLDDLGYTYEH